MNSFPTRPTKPSSPTARRNKPSVVKLQAHPRSFDVLEARSLRLEHGWSYGAIARKMGVSTKTIQRAVDYKQRLYIRRYQREWARGKTCVECGAEKSVKGEVCIDCEHKRRTTTVRDSTLFCSRCEQWKPDEEFRPWKKAPARRGRYYMCRLCAAAYERDRQAGIRLRK